MAAADAGPGRRRRVPAAVPARLRRQVGGRGALRRPVCASGSPAGRARSHERRRADANVLRASNVARTTPCLRAPRRAGAGSLGQLASARGATRLAAIRGSSASATEVAVSPAPAAALLAALAAAALLADRIWVGGGDRASCCSSSACARRAARRWLVSARRARSRARRRSSSDAVRGASGRLTCSGAGRRSRCSAQLDVTRDELRIGALPGAAARRGRARVRRLRAAGSTTTASSRSARFARAARRSRSRWRRGSCRRSSATRPGSSRRCAAAASSVEGCTRRARRCSRRSLAGSLERALNLAEAMEARGFGRRRRRARRSRRGARSTGSRSPRRSPSSSRWRCGSSARREPLVRVPGRAAPALDGRLARARAGRGRRAARPVRRRQVDAAARARRARAALPRRPLRRPGRGRRPRHAAARPGRARRHASPRSSRIPRTRSS